MHDATVNLELAVWAVAEGRATHDERAALETDPAAWQRAIERLIRETKANLASARALPGPERDRVVTDFEDDMSRLQDLEGQLNGGETAAATIAEGGLLDEAGRVRLQASWSAGQVVVWAGGPGIGSTSNGELADLLEAVGGPSLGWSLHTDLVLPSGRGRKRWPSQSESR